jgi:hypothetical protein
MRAASDAIMARRAGRDKRHVGMSVRTPVIGILEHITQSSTAPATAEPALKQRREARTSGRAHLLKNGAQAHELTREERAKGGRVRAEKLRKRKELRERLKIDQLEDLAEAELLDRAVIRLTLLLASDDDRVGLRGSIEVLDRVLGKPKPARSTVERDFAADAESAREKLAEMLERAPAAAA